MFESRDPGKDSQPQFWIEARKLPKATATQNEGCGKAT